MPISPPLAEILDILVQRRRDKRAALRLMRKLLRKQGFAPKLLTTELGSTARLSGSFAWPAHMSRDFAKTIGPRTRTRWCDDVSARCNGSSQLDPPSVS